MWQSHVRSRRRASAVLIGAALVLILALTPGAAEAAQDRFERARELGFAGQRQEARDLLEELLQERPEHWDARVLLGRLYAWDHRYEEARAQLLIVVRERPGYTDARNALIDVELWSDHPDKALEHADVGLLGEPNNQDLLFRKAQAQRDMGRLREASVTLDRLLDRNPSHERGARLLSSIRVRNARNKFAIGYGYTEVDTLTDPWHGASAQLSRRTGIGSFLVRVNWSNRFDRTAVQYEIDGYPRIVDGLYVYLNYGYSQDRLYPTHRYGAEAYANLPRGIELSAGFRRLEFENTDVTIYTGTVAKYVGNWWISVRPYITPKSLGTSQSYAATVRRYFGNRDTYVGLTGGIGSSPHEVRDVVDLVRLDSRKIGTRISWAMGDFFILKIAGGYSWEDLVADRSRNEFNLGIAIERRF